MSEQIKLNNVKYYIVLVFYFLIILACVYFGYRIVEISLISQYNPEVDSGWLFLIPDMIVLIESIIAFITWANRKLLRKELFTISSKGIEDVYAMVFFMIFFTLPNTKLIPWCAIREFKICTWTGGRKYVVAVIDESKLPANTPKLFKLAVSLNLNSSFRGLYFGSRNALMPAEELRTLLERNRKHYSKLDL